MSLLENARREVDFLSGMIRTGRRIRGLRPDGSNTAADVIEAQARRTPEAPAIHFEDRVVRWAEYDARANRFAQWARAQGVGRGDVVALLMENRPEYLFAWLGLAKLGAVTALINTHLRGGPLHHSLSISGARLHVVGHELAEAYQSVAGELEEKPVAWATGGARPGFEDLDAALDAASVAPVGREAREGMKSRDNLFYIYTSGTTGNPKAARFSHFRWLTAANAFAAATQASSGDRVYVVLPLYHTAGGVCATGLALTSGAEIVLRRRFSATQFWEDCRRYDVTLFQYIGELCRYLVNMPEHPDERRHRVRVCIGNGLRPDVWETFQRRFQIPKVVEFYGSTEGNVALVNADGKTGAVGRIPWYLERVMQTRLVRFDLENEEPVRGPDGFCIRCAPGEVGEAIGRIPDDPRATLGHFEGYTSRDATEKKVLRDVFEKGDAWFRSGDLLRQDAQGYFYFVDRIGDTFRWKGENVATSEVAEVISVFPGVKEANVYGVHVPGCDGRAGMAALVVDEGFDRERFHAHLAAQLPAYARPLFLRILPEMEVTGTFKHRKVDLVKDGFDPEKVREPLWFADPEKGAFVPLDGAVHERIVSGAIRL